jgi:hypothetical protein
MARWSRRQSVAVLPAPLSVSVAMTSDVKRWWQLFSGQHDVFVLGASAEAEPVRADG